MTSVLISSAEPELVAQLESSGVRIFTWPALALNELEDHDSLDESIHNLFGYDWLILKNERAAEFFLRRLIELKHHAADLDDVRVLAIGEATAAKLIDARVHIDVSLDRTAATSLVESLASYLGNRDSFGGVNFLMPSANLTREGFEAELEEIGARVDSVIAYRTTSDTRKLAEMNALISGGAIDVAVFSSPQTIEAFAQICDTDDLHRLLAGITIVCANEIARLTAVNFRLDRAIVLDNPAEGVQNLTVSR